MRAFTQHNTFNRQVSSLSILILLCLFVVSCKPGNLVSKEQNLVRHVNPFIGTQGHGHVFLGANVPFGAVQLGPSNIMQTWDKFNGWDWCSGYNYISREILGFTHTHLSGTGIGDLNDILLLPANGKLQLNKASFNDINSGYGSLFSHDKEVCEPGYYKVYLEKYKIYAELTATERVGFHQYTYEQADNAHILVDLTFGMGWDRPTDMLIQQVDETTFTGHRFSTGWAKDQRLYFAIKLSAPVTRHTIADSTGRNTVALFFDAAKNPVIKVKVGISPVSVENALANIDSEIPGWDFSLVRADASAKWNQALGSIKIAADSTTQTVFYTALYHSMFFPSLFNDHNGDYRGADGKMYTNPGHTTYSVFSLWDTYRGLHPLMTIIEPARVNDYIRTFLSIYKQQGKLPVWHLMGNETNTMIGYPAVPIIVDAYLKGFRDYDVNLAYEAVRQSAMQQQDGLTYVQNLLFIPADKVPESVAKAQEYAIADWCIAQMAKSLNKADDYNYFMKRGKLYAEYFDTTVQHMRGRMMINKWRTPFNPFNALHRDNDYCEGNSWQYTWLVPQDVEGLIGLFGGDRAFTTKLDSLFTVSPVLSAGTSPDISGMIGQYAHGNEPNHHIPYLYAYAGQPWKTADIIRKVVDTFYTDKPDGLCGNEDAGEMSAWYVLSAMGFYPVNPANGAFVFGSPVIGSADIRLAGNKHFSIRVENQGKANKYIKRVTLNGKPYTRSFLLYRDIVKGGRLVIYMGAEPSGTFGVAAEDRPRSVF